MPPPSLHHLGNFSIFPDSDAAPAPPPAAPAAPPTDGGLPTVQASLRVNAPGDGYEQEAERMADLVMRSPAGRDSATPERTRDMPSYYVQRTASGAGLDVSPQVESSISQMQGGGQPLPTGERSFFENRFGHDFSQIRIHADDHAASTARSLNARAFTVGTDIAFDSGEYQPGTESGRHLLAHELTHTIQQTGGVATKRVQRKAVDEEAEQAPAPEQAPAEQKSPVDLVAEAAQKLSDDEVVQVVAPPLEAQPVELPEHKPEDAGAAGAAGGGAAGAEAAPAAPQEQATPEQKAAEQQKAAEASAKAAPASAAPAPAAAAPTPAAPAPAEAAPATPTPVKATPAPAPAAEAQTPAAQAPQNTPADSKQNEIIDGLAQKYVEKLQALDSELEQMKEAEKGLLAKAGDLINGVIKTIGELKDLLLNTLRRAAGAVMKILQDPIGFLGNLLSAVGQGLRQFVGNIGNHLKEGLISWLTGALAAGGLQLPTSWDLQGIFSLVMQLLGLTYQQIRAQIVKALGPIGEQVIGALEQAWEVFQIIQNEGLAGLWTFIQDKIGDLQAMVMDQIREMVIGQVIKAGIDWLIGILGGPAGAFIKAVQGIVRVVTWFVENGARMASLVNSVLDSVMAIASGDIGGAANAIEQSLAKALPTVISFLADLLGLGGISQKVQGIIQKARQPIQKGIDWLVQKAVALGKKIWGMLKGKSKGDASTSDNPDKEQQVQFGLAMLHQFEKQQADDGKLSKSGADETAHLTRKQNPVFSSITPVKGIENWEYHYVVQRATEKGDLPIDENDENISKETKKKLKQAFNIYPIESGKCDVCARRVHRILIEAGHAAQIG